MLDQTQVDNSIEFQTADHMLRSAVEKEATFAELVLVTQELRILFPTVRISGPYLLTTENNISLELFLVEDRVEVKVPASQSIIASNDAGW
jgi:hypothetical protein